VRKIKALTIKMEKVTLIDKGRQNVMCIVYEVCQVNSKIYFSRCFIFRKGGLRLELFYIQVNVVI